MSGPDQPMPRPSDEFDRADGAVLHLLTTGDPRPWSIDEILREHGHGPHTLDAVARLNAAGLIHRTQDGYIWASRAAIRADQIAI